MSAGLKQAARLLRRECCHGGEHPDEVCCSWTLAALDVERAMEALEKIDEYSGQSADTPRAIARRVLGRTHDVSESESTQNQEENDG